MTSNENTINQQFIEAIQDSLGIILTCDELKALVNNDNTNDMKVFFGIIQSLNYVTIINDRNISTIDQDIGSTTTEIEDKITLKNIVIIDSMGGTYSIDIVDDNNNTCVAKNLNDFDRVIKNAFDSEHAVILTIKNDILTSVTLKKPSSLDSDQFQLLFSRAKRGTQTTDD